MKRAFLLLFICSLVVVLRGQEYEPSSALPLDKSFTIGKLDNGLTYYIRENGLPQKHVELRLVVKAGSILEDEDQLGLAHLIEHMAFNGTKHFQKNELIHYLQRMGVKFGHDLNAYTSFDETVYILPIPLDKKEYFMQGMQILRDWAGDISFDEKEIEKEKGVVTEEWRSSLGASTRISNKMFPKLLYKSKYAERMPIGKMEVVNSASRETITRFYRDWYRPDLMAVVVCGDISATEVKPMIEKLFGDLKNPDNARPRVIESLPTHKEVVVSRDFDKELIIGQLSIMHKLPKKELSKHSDYRRILTNSLFNIMMSKRFAEISTKADAPFLGASSSISDQFMGGVRTFSISASFGKEGFDKAVRALLRENERAKRFGFVQQEFDDAKKAIKESYDRLLKEKNNHQSSSYAEEMIRNFLQNEAMPGIDYEHQLTNHLLKEISLEEINAKLPTWITQENRVVMVNAPSADSLSIPSEKEIVNIINKLEYDDLSPYVYKEVTDSLMSGYTLPARGEVVNEKVYKKTGIYEWKLSNGATVYLLPTPYKNDEILFSAYSEGGFSQYGEEDYTTLARLPEMMQSNGLNTLSNTALQKIMADKSIRISSSIAKYSESLSGSSARKDITPFFESLHLKMRKVYWDQEAISSVITQTKAVLPYLQNNPELKYGLEVMKWTSNEHPLMMKLIPSLANYEGIDFKRAEEIYYERFDNAADFTFFFVGTFSAQGIKPYIEQYIASLPSDLTKLEEPKDLKLTSPSGVFKRTVYAGLEEKSYTSINFTGLVEGKKGDFFSFYKVLENRLLDILREDKSGVYGVKVDKEITRFPEKRYTISISFGCDPKRKDELVASVFEEIKKIQTDGVPTEEYERTIQTRLETIEKANTNNRYWLMQMQAKEIEGKSMKEMDKLYSNQVKKIKKVKASQIQLAANSYIDFSNYQQYDLMPAAYENKQTN